MAYETVTIELRPELRERLELARRAWALDGINYESDQEMIEFLIFCSYSESMETIKRHEFLKSIKQDQPS